jgi:hypothetical protein
MSGLVSNLGVWLSMPLRMRITFWEFLAVIFVSDILLEFFLPNARSLTPLPYMFLTLVWNLSLVILYNGLKTY